MIFVTLGTQDKSFERLLKAIEKQVKEKKIKDKVIVQAGSTKFKSDYMEVFDLIPMDEFNKLIKECDILITHGGVGSILEGVKNKKIVIAAAREAKYKEHTNDHQKQIVGEFSKRGYILELKDFSKLHELIKESKNFKPKKYKSNTENVTKLLADYIEKENNTSWFNKVVNLIMHGFYDPITCLVTIFIFWLLTLSKCNILISNIIAGIITVILTYVMFRKDFTGRIRFKFLFNRLIGIGIETAFLYALAEYCGMWKIKVVASIFVIFVSFLISIALRCCSQEKY